MIKTRLKPGFDPKREIPAGSTVAILGCASCGAVCGTSDTRRIDELSNQLAGHCRVIFAATVEAPCDQRVLRHFIRDSSCALTRADTIVALACEAGTRSLGILLSGMGLKPLMIAPLETREYSILGADGTSTRACRFCNLCIRPSTGFPCPVAVCPLGRIDGPCQNRPRCGNPLNGAPEVGASREASCPDETCIVESDMDCPWFAAGNGISFGFHEAENPATNSTGAEFESCVAGRVPMSEGFAVVAEPGDDAEEFVNSMLACVREAEPSMVFLAAGSGLNPLAAAAMLLARGFTGPLGLAADTGQMNSEALESLILSASAMKFKGFYVREIKTAGTPVNQIGTVALIEMARSHLLPGSLIVADNAFSHQADMLLLHSQIAVGLSAAAVRIGVSFGSRDDIPSICRLIESPMSAISGNLHPSRAEAADLSNGGTPNFGNFVPSRFSRLSGLANWPTGSTSSDSFGSFGGSAASRRR